ncbi:MAG: tRNA uracil 4-sulfurtransferase ThiI [Christensenellales bacterium]|jgi:thiamine biosynthesis protein ThiI|nr:tRNA uracil 4-sulfurtransferase ThiI [Clostridia bacterium]HRU84664.1 tRNA uracil 4-sulfurtransferase ThiI [Eubacteriales bacterium]
MKKIIIVRYGEIFLKGNNRDYFISLLIKNIKEALVGLNYYLVKAQGRVLIENYAASDENAIFDRLLTVFGIYSLSKAVEIETDVETIKETALLLSPDSGKFRVTVNRADKKMSFTSVEIASMVGGYILKSKSALSVDLHRFETEISIDIRENGRTFLYSDVVKGLGGLPVGCSGSGILMLSGGIDSPVAGFMMAKRGLKLFAVHFHSAPYTSEQAKEKVLDLARIISKFCGKIKVFVVPFTEIQLEIHKKCPAELMITIMRRFMMQISGILAKENGCGAIVTGESLGQVASQTLQSLNATNSVASLPVLRPLIGFDKSDIIEIAQKIGTFETSILPYEDCCTIFLPKNPAIKPKLEVVERAERALDAESLISTALTSIETYEVDIKAK